MFHHVGGATVAKHVGAGLVDAAVGTSRSSAHHLPDPLSSECAATNAEEQSPLHSLAREWGTAALHIFIERLDCPAPERDDPLLVAFAADLGASLIEMQVLLAERDDLADAKATGVKQLKDCVIPESEGGRFTRAPSSVGVAGRCGATIEHLGHFALRERLWQHLPGCWRLDGHGGIVRDPLVEQQPTIEAAQTAQLARYGARIDEVAAQVRHKAADVTLDRCRKQSTAVLQLLGELLQIASVGLATGWTQTPFDAQIYEI